MKLLKNLSHPNIVVSICLPFGALVTHCYCLIFFLAGCLTVIVTSFFFKRYLGTAREDESLNILLEFVPGGSISSLLGKFGSFPESVSVRKFIFFQQ